MPTIDLTPDELVVVLSAVAEEIDNAEAFIADVDPQRVDAQRAVHDLAFLESAYDKLEAHDAHH